MTLMFQIAGGIILAVLFFAFWPIIIGGGLLLVGLGIVATVAIVAFYYLQSHPELLWSLGIGIGAVIVLIAAIIAAVIIYAKCHKFFELLHECQRNKNYSPLGKLCFNFIRNLYLRSLRLSGSLIDSIVRCTAFVILLVAIACFIVSLVQFDIRIMLPAVIGIIVTGGYFVMLHRRTKALFPIQPNKTSHTTASEDNKALKEFLINAENGDVISQFYLGNYYSNGLHTPANYKEAAQWLHLVVDSGDEEQVKLAQETLEYINRNAQNISDDEPSEEIYKKVQLVQFKCKYAENFVNDVKGNIPELADSAKEKLEDYIQACMATSKEVNDEFCNSTMLHSISNLLCKAGQFKRAHAVIDFITIDFIRELAKDYLTEEQKKNE